MNIGKYPWTYAGRSNGQLVYFNEEDGSIALEDLQEGRLIDPAGPVVLDKEPGATIARKD